MINETEYLGDGVFVKFDGCLVWLLANSRTSPTDRVALKPETLESLISFAEDLKAFIEQHEDGESKS